ncbi:putative protein YphB [Paraburkholderia aspalathi]|uniref:aldose 1-epimerase n=1 Tax=Paraburkholderia aspalathi TaxID=1324617 RepID=UPI00190B6E19|nr:aldose 1-epimerase [Paraburkholderia aspalathi]MBK3843704.1 aldose 1-epimerase [Paraburkholderia aspalathi]CAE6858828.1 putative protein YphB [Paraburkholderia aspalathi]CAE6866617.1 putative protein YphB [Paraburkholderia aspalathi]
MTFAHEMLELVNGTWCVRIAPSLGGAIVDARWRGRDVLRPTDDGHLRASDVRKTACYPLVPFSNRIGNAQFDFDGATHAIDASFTGEPHAIHGVGFQRPWQVVGGNARAAELQLMHRSDGAWPFAFVARQRIAINADTLTLMLSITNRDSRYAPCGLGWHPFFPLCTAEGQTNLRSRWTAMLVNGADKLPYGVVNPAELRPMDAVEIDNCFTGWERHASIETPHHMIRIEASEALRCVVLFRPSGQPFFAFEPVTHANDALHGQQPAMHVLAPRETLDASVTFALSPNR